MDSFQNEKPFLVTRSIYITVFFFLFFFSSFFPSLPPFQLPLTPTKCNPALLPCRPSRCCKASVAAIARFRDSSLTEQYLADLEGMRKVSVEVRVRVCSSASKNLFLEQIRESACACVCNMEVGACSGGSNGVGCRSHPLEAAVCFQIYADVCTS